MPSKSLREAFASFMKNAEEADTAKSSFETLLKARKGSEETPQPLMREWEQFDAARQKLVTGDQRQKNLDKFLSKSRIKHKVFHGDAVKGVGSKEILNDPLAFDQPREMGVHVGDFQQANMFTTGSSHTGVEMFERQTPSDVEQFGLQGVKTKDQMYNEALESIKRMTLDHKEFELKFGSTEEQAIKSAREFAERRTAIATRALESQGFVEPYYVNIENPILLEDRGDWGSDVVIKQLRERFPEDDEELVKLLDESHNSADDRGEAETARKVWNFLEERGFDSIEYENESEGVGRRSYILKSRSQVKSAVGNSGEFRAEVENILRGITGTAVGGGAASQVDTGDEGA